MEKVDYKRELKYLYTAPSDQPVIVDVPYLSYLMVDGNGDPNTVEEYQEAVVALYSVAYTLKFAIKRGGGLDYTVMPLEGLWWVDDMSTFSDQDKSAWIWTMMILQPDEVTTEQVEQAVTQAASKKPLPAASKMRLERLREGRAAQIMHIGPFSAERSTIDRLHDFIADQGSERTGKHHEIYLGDPRRTAPQQLRTIIRQPMASA